MLKDRRFLIWLAVFVVIAGWHVALLWPKSPGYRSIGGGGYDLSNFVYTLTLLAFTALWSLVAALISMARRDALAARRANWLAAAGAITFVVAAIAFGHHLR